MDFGKIEYEVYASDTERMKLHLTLVGLEDFDVLKSEGLAALRRRRLGRLTREALAQGWPLSYDELSMLLFTSVSTLKRDVVYIEKTGERVSLRGRKRRMANPVSMVVKGAC